jgi:hypothetical protein
MSCGHCFRKVKCSEKFEQKEWCGGCVPGTSYITYPECKEYFHSGVLYRVKPETIPMYPPWTTWNGVLKTPKDSKFAEWLKNMDPHTSEIEEKGLLYVKGLWTASKSPIEYCVKLI